MNRHQYKAVLNHLKGGLPDEKVLDIGFGNGVLINKLTNISEATFYGIDISEDIIKKANDVNRRGIASGRVFLSQGTVTELNFPSEYFDSIYTVNTIYFWNDLSEGLKEINRVLKPGGSFLNVAYTKQWLDKLPYTQYGFMKYEMSDLIKKVEEAGLEVFQIAELKQDVSYCMVIKKKDYKPK